MQVDIFDSVEHWSALPPGQVNIYIYIYRSTSLAAAIIADAACHLLLFPMITVYISFATFSPQKYNSLIAQGID